MNLNYLIIWRKESDADLKMEKTEDEMKPEEGTEEKLEEKVEEKIEDEVEEVEGPCSSPKAIAMTITKVGFRIDTSCRWLD